MKKGSFAWTNAASRTFETIKKKLCLALTLVLPNFELLFEVKCDASSIGIMAILTIAKWALAYFSEKLSGHKLNYSNYDKESFVSSKVSPIRLTTSSLSPL